MRHQVSPRLRAFAKVQRRAMTRAETIIWRELRGGRFHAHKFRRQVPIGPFVADFVCFAARLIVELDGEPHDRLEQRLHDIARDDWLRQQGFRVLRFPNDLILGNAGLALDRIAQELSPSSPSPDPA